MTVRSNLLIRAGDTWYSNPYAIIRGGQAVDLSSGWEVRAQIRQRRNSGLPFFSFDTDDGTILIGEAEVMPDGDLSLPFTTSAIQLHLPGEVTDDWPSFAGVYDLEISKPDEDFTFTATAGSARVTRDITRG